jgi:acid phosphatase type 7
MRFSTKNKKLIAIIFVAAQVGALYGLVRAFSSSIYGNLIKGPYLSWSGANLDPNSSNTTMTISWRTSNAESGFVDYGSDLNSLTRIAENKNGIQHAIRLTGLQPNTTYYYRVGNDATMTSLYNFTTMATHPLLVRFCAYGDTRPPNSRNAEVVERMAEKIPEFWLHVGDLVGGGGTLENWNTFLDEIRPLTPSSPFMPVIGNHEYYDESSNDPVNFKEIFALPGDESSYAFSVGDILFLAINTRVDNLWTPGHAIAANEFAFANQTLFNNYQKFRWIVVFFHYPAYSSGGMDSAVIGQVRWLTTKYDVDLVLTGHNHNYERFNVPNNVTSNTNVTYVVTGGGGAPLDDANQTPLPYSQIYKSVYEYTYYEVNATKIACKTYAINNTIIDTWSLSVKDRATLATHW